MIVVSGMLGSGTTYYTAWLRSQGHHALHEHVYRWTGVFPPEEGQTHEVSGFSFGKQTDVLLLRDPRKQLRTLGLHSPHWPTWTAHNLGYNASNKGLLFQSWIDCIRLALAEDPEVVRIEDVPVVPGLRRHETGRGHRKPYTWGDLPAEVSGLARQLGYT